MNRGDVYRIEDRLPERGFKPGYYVVVSRTFVARNPRIATVICAPIYTRTIGTATEVPIGAESGIPHPSSIRCDFMTLVFKHQLVRRVGGLSAAKIAELDRALAAALDLGMM